MSLKYTVLFTCLFLITNNINSVAWADYNSFGTDTEEDFDTAIAKRQMSPLFPEQPMMDEHTIMSSLTEDQLTPNSDLSLTDQVDKALDKLNVVNWNLPLDTNEDIQMLKFAKLLQFSPETLFPSVYEWEKALKEEALTEDALKERVQVSLSKQEDYFKYQTLDE